MERKERIGTIDADGLPLLGVSNKDGLHRSGMPRIPNMNRYFRVESEWFAYNPMRVNVGSIGWAHSDSLVGVISPDYVVFSCTPKIDPRLLYWFLTSEVGLRAINLQTAGSVRERLYFASLARVAMPLPPVVEQRRIVERLGALTAKVQTVLKLQSDVSTQLESLIQSVTSELFEAASDQYGVAKLSSLIVDAGYGTSVKCGIEREPDSFPVLRIPNVASGAISLSDMKFGVLSERELEDLAVEAGDVLVVRTNGSLDLVGRCAVVEELSEPTAFASYLIRLRCDQNRVLPQFLQSALNYLRKSRWLGEFARTTAGQYNVSLGRIHEAEIPLPPPEEQDRIVQRLRCLERHLRPCYSMRVQLDTETNAVTASILDQAFSGQL